LPISDEGLSGYKGHNLERGSLGHFLAEVRAGKIPAGTALIIENLDRLSRQGIDKTTDLLKALTQSGIDVHVIHGLSTTVLKAGFNNDLSAYITIGVSAKLAHEESEKKSQRIGSAWKVKKIAAASGKLFTRNIPSWLKVENDKIVERSEYVSMVKEMFSMASQGIGSKNICGHFNGAVSRAFVVKTLCNRSVLGEFRPKGSEVIYGYFPEIISPSEFNAVRAIMNSKRKNGNYIGGSRSSASADNLLSGIIFDITTDPNGKPMYYQKIKGGFQYLETAFTAKGKHDQNRTRYDKLEHSILAFLEKEDWVAIAGRSESDEYKSTKVALEATLSLLDKAQRHIETMKLAMDGEDIETVKVAIRSIAKDEAVILSLTAQKDALNQALEASKAKLGALYEGEELQQLIKEVVNDPSLRLRLRAELRKRIARIELFFIPNKFGVHAIVKYVNGVQGMATIFGSATREAALSRGLKEIDLGLYKPEIDLKEIWLWNWQEKQSKRKFQGS